MYKTNKIKQDVLSFLKAIDQDFIPSLSCKVNLEEYIDKILKKANLICCYSPNRTLIGLIIFYCNNTITHKAYISLVGVHKNFRGKGIAKKMMEECISFIDQQNYPIIGIHSNNPTAIRLYKNFNFQIVEGGTRKYMELNLAENKLLPKVYRRESQSYQICR